MGNKIQHDPNAPQHFVGSISIIMCNRLVKKHKVSKLPRNVECDGGVGYLAKRVFINCIYMELILIFQHIVIPTRALITDFCTHNLSEMISLVVLLYITL